MSVVIRVYTHIDDKGRRHYIYDEPAGAEIWRHKLYGSSAIKSLGCTLLPALFDPGNIGVKGADLERLEQEIEIVMQNKELVIRDTGYDPENFNWAFRVIDRAILLAKQSNGTIDVV